MSELLKLPSLCKLLLAYNFHMNQELFFEPFFKQHILALCQPVFQLARVNHFGIFSTFVCDCMLSPQDCLEKRHGQGLGNALAKCTCFFNSDLGRRNAA